MVDGQAKAFEKDIKVMAVNSDKKEVKPLIQGENSITGTDDIKAKRIFTFRKQRRIKRTKCSRII